MVPLIATKPTPLEFCPPEAAGVRCWCDSTDTWHDSTDHLRSEVLEQRRLECGEHKLLRRIMGGWGTQEQHTEDTEGRSRDKHAAKQTHYAGQYGQHCFKPAFLAFGSFGSIAKDVKQRLESFRVVAGHICSCTWVGGQEEQQQTEDMERRSRNRHAAKKTHYAGQYGQHCFKPAFLAFGLFGSSARDVKQRLESLRVVAGHICSYRWVGGQEEQQQIEDTECRSSRNRHAAKKTHYAGQYGQHCFKPAFLASGLFGSIARDVKQRLESLRVVAGHICSYRREGGQEEQQQREDTECRSSSNRHAAKKTHYAGQYGQHCFTLAFLAFGLFGSIARDTKQWLESLRVMAGHICRCRWGGTLGQDDVVDCLAEGW